MPPDSTGKCTHRKPQTWAPWLRAFNVAVAILTLVLGLIVQGLGGGELARYIWTAGVIPVLVTLLVEITSSLRHGEVGLDIVAALSMGASVAFGAPLAGIVIALMYSGGQYLEVFAEGRARREMTALLGRVARTALRYHGETLEETPIEVIVPGDRLLIRSGEVVPVDGIANEPAVLDEATLTGESLPVERTTGAEVFSGTTSVGAPFAMTATRAAAASAYARITQLVAAAQQSKAPMSRLADRYALGFLIVTLAVASGAWLLSGDPVRALAVLVVATPCPLILAVPIAIVSGMSRCARDGLLIKSGSVLESLARIKVVVFDKTGTLTEGEAALVTLHATGGLPETEVLRLAASLDQASGHVVAAAIVSAAHEAGLHLSLPADVTETVGTGIIGSVDGLRVAVGGRGFIQRQTEGAATQDLSWPTAEGCVLVVVAVDGQVAGVLELADRVRPEAVNMLQALRALGIRRLVLASGDAVAVAQAVARVLGVDAVYGELSPEDKVALVVSERGNGPILMVGDGVNDAPALAAADVGVALGVRGAVASSEVADAVLLIDRIDPLAAGVATAQHARQVAMQSVVAGIGLSFMAMGIAAFGYLTPVQGALVQEVIDVAVILNALRPLANWSAPDLPNLWTEARHGEASAIPS